MAYQFFQNIREKCRTESFNRMTSHFHDATPYTKGSDDAMPYNKGSKEAPLSDLSPDWSEFEGCYVNDLVNAEGKFGVQRRFLKEIAEVLIHYVNVSESRSSKVLDFHHPHQLKEMMAHCIEVDENKRDLEQILSDCKETLKYCVRTGHPRFLNQFSTGLDVIGMAGEWLTAAANTNMFTYEVAPVFTLMEEVILQRMLRHVGWEDGDGIFAPGGAISNMYGMLAARHDKYPDIKTKGLQGVPRMAVFTSTHSHFSIKRAASLLGLGTDSVIYIRCDDRGRMSIDHLLERIKAARAEGIVPLMINATCGTTVLGAFDPVDRIADICEKFGIWLHIDGAWGGSVLLSRHYRHLLDGIHRANSMTWNPHKMMGVPLQCSAILLRDKGILSGMNKLGASYLYQPDKNYDVTYDTGDKAIQCGRHNDIFKLWLMWRSKGDSGFESQVNKNFQLAQYFLNKIRERPKLKLVIDEIQGPNVCFWYVPEDVAKIENRQERHDQLHKIAPRLKAAMMEKGSMMLAYQPIEDLPNFFRIAISNPALTERDLDFVISELEELAEEI